MSIEGKKIFITGSTGGIGTAICNEYLNKTFTKNCKSKKTFALLGDFNINLLDSG